MIGVAAPGGASSPRSRGMGRLGRAAARAGAYRLDRRWSALDRSTIWPYDERGEPREFYLPALRQPDRRRRGGRASASWTAAPRSSSPPAPARRRRSSSRCSSRATRSHSRRGCYFGTGVTFAAFERWGLRVVEFDQTGPPPDGVQLVWLEAPSNPYLTMPDLEAAAAHPAPVVVDATVATPVHLRPLEHGADFVLHSATKYLAGHDDALLGAVVCRDDAAAEELRTLPRPHRHRRRAGSRLAPAARPEDARAARPPPDRDRAAARRAAASASGGRDRPLSRPRRPGLLRRGRRGGGAQGRDVDRA